MTRYSPGSDELTGGQWVTKPGGLRVWVPDTPYEDRSRAGEAGRMVLAILRAIAEGSTTCACGCLLISRHETCPNCQTNEQSEVA